MNLVSVYTDDAIAFNNNCLFLYDLLKERDPAANISHRGEMPPFFQHVTFVQSRPYHAWYIAEHEGEKIGSAYLTNPGPGMYGDEIGIFLSKGWKGRGFGAQILHRLMQAHPRPRYLANVAPGNEASLAFFEKQGFKPLQVTYELRRE